MDCTLELEGGGTMTCETGFVLKGDSCIVECYHYEEYDPVPATSYYCKIDGSWEPPLPICAVPVRSNKKLLYS